MYVYIWDSLRRSSRGASGSVCERERDIYVYIPVRGGRTAAAGAGVGGGGGLPGGVLFAKRGTNFFNTGKYFKHRCLYTYSEHTIICSKARLHRKLQL